MHTTFTIRPLAAQDESFLWEMLYQAIYVPDGQPLPPRSILDEPDIAQYVRDWGQRPGDMGVVAVDPAADKPVGAAWLRLFGKTNPGYGYVDDATPELSIAILPEYRGQGVGTLLLDSLLQAASQRFAAISLSVAPENPAARLYSRMGFETVSASGSTLTMLKQLK